jgi:hypothetical protein
MSEVDAENDGDQRPYSIFKKPGSGHSWVRCRATQEREGRTLHCQYVQRRDHFIQSQKEQRSHKCIFKREANIAQLLTNPRQSKSPLLDELADFVGAHNIPLRTGASDAMRALLERAFHAGFKAGAAHPKADPNLSWREACPQMRSTALRDRIICRAEDRRACIEARLAERPFCALTMDGGQIQSTKLFITNIIVSNVSDLGSTHSIEAVDAMNCETLSTIVVRILDDLDNRKIHISSVTCDGATYQIKALNFEDPLSIQAQNPDKEYLFKLLYIPCLCHRLNNAYQCLFRTCAPFREMIKSLRTLAVLCRKPEHRRALGRSCPTFIQTRWLYDKRLLDFILAHEAKIEAFVAIPDAPLFHQCSRLLTIFFKVLRNLEGRNSPLALAVPLLADAISRFESIARTTEGPASVIYHAAAEQIRLYCLETTYGLFHLAYVLIPKGHKEARAQQLARLTRAHEEEEQIDPAIIEVEMRDLPVDLDREHEDLVSQEEEDLSERGFFDDVDANRAAEKAEEQENVDLGETQIVRAEVDNSWRYLPDRARSALERIARQFRLSEEASGKLLAAFDDYLECADSEIRLTIREGGREYIWMSSVGMSARYLPLADIALRLEPAPCSEAPTERAIGEARRLLMPHRTAMKPDLLLAMSSLAVCTGIEPDPPREVSCQTDAPDRRRSVWDMEKDMSLGTSDDE